MADLPPLPPRRTDRELPARPTRELPPRPQVAPPEGRATKPSKPDARPMRIVYGAGAVAAVSVIAVGLVQPDFAATADQPADAAVADVANVDTNSGIDPNAPVDTTRHRRNRHDPAVAQPQPPNVQVRHVVRYVHLKPGQTAPPGATVITPNAPQPRVVVANNPTPTQPPGQAHQPPPAAHNPPPVAHNPPPTHKPPVAQPPPAPNPPPPVKSHQSGRR